MNKFLLVSSFSVFLLACSDEGEEEAGRQRGDHAFKEQIKAIDKAKEVNKIIDTAAQRQRDASQQQ